MTVPGWWNERRYGLFVHASIATVPSFSPIGEYADWYWSHLGSDPLPGLGPSPHPSPMAEVLAYHRDRWSHVERYDDFIPFLSYHLFDADEQVEVAAGAGMNYLVHVARHHDGFCWWDAPGTARTSVHQGPRRDVMAEVAAACRRHGVQFGTSYALQDWADRRLPEPSYVDGVLHPQVLDLVERYGTHILWGEVNRTGNRLHGSDGWRSEALLERAQNLADAQGYELVFNDRWGHPQPSFATFEYDPPDDIELRPWELYRGLGASLGHNRAERPEHLLSTGALFDLLTEVIAKGGNLLLDVGPSVDGTISDIQQRPLREVGAWVNSHADVIHGSRPFDTWGDAQVRYLRVTDDVVALDLAAGSEVVLSGLTPDQHEVTSIEADDGGSLHWEQHRGGVIVSRIDRSPAGLAGTYRIRLRPAAEPIRLFDEREMAPKPLQSLLDDAIPGDVINLQEGRYQGPITVPHGVTLCGVGWDRTAVIGAGCTVATLDDGARIENIHFICSPAPVDNTMADGPPAPAVLIRGAGTAIVGCRCDGCIIVDGDDASVLSVNGTGVVGTAERTTVERCAFKGRRWDFGIALTGGSGHRIHRNEVVEHLGSVRLRDVSASVVSENRFEGRWWAVHLQQCEHVSVVDNIIRHTMRAVDVFGGNGSIITGNRVADGDSGALIEFGATDTSVTRNHVERCRIGVLVWDAPATRVGPNTFVDLHEEDSIVHGPDTETD